MKKNKFDGKYCYLCGAPAVSMEHAPARGFFPEKDELRVNLIKVPSCKVHNELTSNDDQYIRDIISWHIGNNQIGTNHGLQKLQSTIRRPESAGIVTEYRGKMSSLSNGLGCEEVDMERFERVMRKIAYAIFFHEYEVPWNRQLGVIPYGFAEIEEVARQRFIQKKLINFLLQSEASVPDFKGDNPQIFKYRFRNINPEDSESILLQMFFYEGFEVWIMPDLDSTSFSL